MHPNEKLIRKLFDTFGRRELNAAVALFADDTVFRVSGRSAISGTYYGHAGVLNYWRSQIDLSAGSLQTQPVSIDPKEDGVVVDVLITAERDGRPVSWHRTVDYRVAGGKIVEAFLIEGDQEAADAFFSLGNAGDTATLQ